MHFDDVPTARPNLYQFVLDGPGTTLRQRLRYRLANEAITDPTWREHNDPKIDGELLALEQQEFFRPRAPKPGQVLLTPDCSAVEATRLHWVRLIELGEPITCPPADQLDLVAAAVAGELWLACHGAADFNAAAFLGPDATTTLASLLARSMGEGVTPDGLPDERPSVGFSDAPVLAAADAAERWVRRYPHLPAGSWQPVLRRVVTDLRADTAGDSAASEAALVVRWRERSRGRLV